MNRRPPFPQRETEASRVRPRTALAIAFLAALLLPPLLLAACSIDERRSSIPPGAQAVIERVTDDIAAGRDDKLYDEAAEEWRRAAAPAQNKEMLERLRTRLGKVESRSFLRGREQQSAGGDLPGHSLVVSYQTTFEHAEGMETFTLVERDGRWLLARYAVSSDALK
jgi:hypothetical protein